MWLCTVQETASKKVVCGFEKKNGPKYVEDKLGASG